MVIYGIKNCDTVKKAVQWLRSKNVVFDFHDYKAKGITENKLKEWSKQITWENLLNRRGTTWRQLEESEKAKVTTEDAAVALMKDKTSIIKRPIIEKDGKIILIGFEEEEYLRKI